MPRLADLLSRLRTALSAPRSAVSASRFHAPLSRCHALRGNASPGRSASRRLFLEFLEHRQLLATITVTSVTDKMDGDTSSIAALQTNPGPDGVISLREAIWAQWYTDNVGGPDRIEFNIPGPGPHKIMVGSDPGNPGTPLPPISDATILDGYTQPGALENTDPVANNAILKIEIDGSLANSGANGLYLSSFDGKTSNHSEIRGLAINGFSGSGIVVEQSANSIIAGNFVGTNLDGEAVPARQQNGVWVTSIANGNTIGGTSAADRNLIANNDVGVRISGVSSGPEPTNNRVVGNLIGVDPTGLSAVPNQAGVLLGGIGNTVGGTTPAKRNIISGQQVLTSGFIGAGVSLEGIDNIVQGNYIGTNAAGTGVIPNVEGIRGGGRNGLIGGTITGAGNVISGNTYGLNVSSGGTGSQVRVQGNLIGTDPTGNISRANTMAGVFVQGLNLSPLVIGGDTPAARNVISGNGTGILLHSSGATIQGNYIGLNKAGTAALSNGAPGNGAGIYIHSTAGNTQVGGSNPGEGNFISGNNRSGIVVAGATQQNRIQGNLIGIAGDEVTGMPNFIGIELGNGAQNQLIGGPNPGEGNEIANNYHGIQVGYDFLTPPFARANSILGNSIYNTVQSIGIDLRRPGESSADPATPNDLGDADVGNNDLQNHPELSAAFAGATTSVAGTLNSTPSSTFRVEFFASASANPQGHVEGQRYLGFTTVVTDPGGNASFNVVLATATAAGELITATATDAAGNTSEFSPSRVAMDPVQIVSVNIQPESLNIDSNGTLTVVIYGAADFNAAAIDVASVRFAGAAVWHSTLVDANNDGRLDLQVKFRTQDTILDDIYAQLLLDDHDHDGVLDSTQQVAEVAVTGETLDDALFSGTDSINLFLAGRSLRNLLNSLFG